MKTILENHVNNVNLFNTILVPNFNWNCYQFGVSGLESQNQRRINSKIYLVQRKLK